MEFAAGPALPECVLNITGIQAPNRRGQVALHQPLVIFSRRRLPRVQQAHARSTHQDEAAAPEKKVSPHGFYSSRITGVPGATILASSAASQFVSRTHPWDSAWPTNDGSGVP